MPASIAAARRTAATAHVAVGFSIILAVLAAGGCPTGGVGGGDVSLDGSWLINLRDSADPNAPSVGTLGTLTITNGVLVSISNLGGGDVDSTLGAITDLLGQNPTIPLNVQGLSFPFPQFPLATATLSGTGTFVRTGSNVVFDVDLSLGVGAPIVGNLVTGTASIDLPGTITNENRIIGTGTLTTSFSGIGSVAIPAELSNTAPQTLNFELVKQ